MKGGGVEVLREKSCTSVTLCTKNPKLTALQSKQVLSFEKPETAGAGSSSTPSIQIIIE